MLATLAKVCSENSVQFKLVKRRYKSSSVADKKLANVGLDVGVDQSDNDPTRPGRTQILTALFKAKH